ncbi:MAG: hypothetical protein MUP73_04900, partial [Dehalococcoidia bacterium]|nr:hypothetical protein [Dehalococcoidia bacterium]
EMKRLVASGKAVIHDTADTLPKGKHPENVQGLTTADGVTHYVADRLTPESLENVALHEVGVHVGMEKLVGPEVYADITRQALNNVGAAFDAARAAIPKGTPTHLRHHEALAYLVENSPQLPIVKKIVSAVRNFARTHLGMKVALTEADARQLAVKALRRESKTSERTARKEAVAYSVKPTASAQQIAADLASKKLVKTSDKTFAEVFRKTLDSVKSVADVALIRNRVVDDTSALGRALRSLSRFSDEGVMRGDFLLQQTEQVMNVLRNSNGTFAFSEDGTLVGVEDERLALKNIYKRIDALGYAEGRVPFFSVTRALAGEHNLLRDIDQRMQAKNLTDFVKVLKGDASALTEAMVDTKRALRAATTEVERSGFKDDLKVVEAELQSVNAKIKRFKGIANKLYARHGRVSAVDMQTEIGRLEAAAQAKRDKAATTTDFSTRSRLLSTADSLTAKADAAIEKLDKGVGTEKRVSAADIAEAKALLAADPRLEPIMKDMWDMFRSLVDLAETSGLIDAHKANDWRDNPSYIPLYKSMEDLEAKLKEDPTAYVQNMTVPTNKQLFHALEGSLQTVNVGENMATHVAMMTVASSRNNSSRVALEQLTSLGSARVVPVKKGGKDPEG